MTEGDVTKPGTKALKMEIAFNEKAGFGSKGDRLPKFFNGGALPPYNIIFKITGQKLDPVHNY